jgi:hypothetical protein
MKYTLIILSILLPFFAQAGGGGGLRPGMEMMTANSPEIVFNLGDKDGIARFAHGQLINNQWHIQKMEIPKANLLNQQEVISALQESKTKGDWAQIR